MTNLVAEGVYKSFGRNPVLVGLDLAVEDGALAAIVGASGSGKTTLLRVAAGFERADKGTICLGDLVVDGDQYVPPEARGIGYVPQEGALFPHLNVRRNVAFGLRRSDRSSRVDEVLELVGLAGLERRYPHQLSGGQQQRVALARALAIRPRVVLLDEPFSSLDAALRASVREDVSRVLREAGATTVLVTHDQDEALSFADRVGVLRDGKIVQIDTPAVLYRRPADVGVAKFVGQANLLPGVIEGRAARCALGVIEVSDPPAPGTEVTVLIRPEQLRLAPAGPAGPPDGSAPGASDLVIGVVVHEEYYGHDAVLRIELLTSGGGAGATPQASGSGVGERTEVVARTAGEDPPALGTVVSLRVAGAARAFERGE